MILCLYSFRLLFFVVHLFVVILCLSSIISKKKCQHPQAVNKYQNKTEHNRQMTTHKHFNLAHVSDTSTESLTML